MVSHVTKGVKIAFKAGKAAKGAIKAGMVIGKIVAT